MSMQGVLRYLTDLEANNSREWFHQNKARYAEANQSFEALVRSLQLELGRDEPDVLRYEPKQLTFRLMRDTRFSHDKSPYMPALRAHIAPMGKLPIPVGAYLMIRPGGRSFLGGGLFADMFTDATGRVRSAIAANGGEWDRIVNDDGFKRLFTIGGTALKNVPRGFDPGHPQAQSLKNKSWYLEYLISDDLLLQDDFIDLAIAVFQEMRPFNFFLNHALEGFQMPER